MTDDIRDMASEAMFSTALTAMFYFPEHFEREFCGLHRDIFKVIDDDSLITSALAAPRGFGKTTIIDLAYLSRKALYRHSKFIVIVSNTLDHAIEQLSTFKREIESNERIQLVFGDQKGRIWRDDRIELTNGTYILARGARQQIRGSKHGRFRPDEIIGDDLEDSEAVMNEERRRKFKSWFFGDLMRAGARSGHECRVRIIGTILHEDSLLQNLLDSNEWPSLRLEAWDDNYVPAWPDFLDSEEIENLRRQYEEMGQLDVLNMEYRNIPIDPSTKVFPQIHHYDVGDPIFSMVSKLITTNSSPRFVIVDPAKTVNMTSDPSAIGGFVVDTQVGTAYLHDLVSDRLTPDGIFESAFDMADRLRTPIIFIEEDSLNLWLTTTAKAAMARRAQSRQGSNLYDIRPLKTRGRKKEDRIAKLAPMHRLGQIMHNRSVSEVIDKQLAMFPRSKFDDAMDMEAYLIEILAQFKLNFDMTSDGDMSPEDWRKAPEYSDRSTYVDPVDWGVC